MRAIFYKRPRHESISNFRTHSILKISADWRKCGHMSEKTKQDVPVKQDSGKLKDAEKQARLAEALRANLRRRKEQQRTRKTED
ncbi:hypothetical protein SAMN04488071_0590 [Kordiimonas lacus]|uniref:Uncharacterized protein n=1 Tax=Kordiimonas lacus TaxID=637679 RepID=A0A1G6UJ01_9PROT|nr:hypothetical protein SAMN04488071_0590 [Kordiimonas lacus]